MQAETGPISARAREAAEATALSAAAWLAGNDEVLPVFLGASGLTLDGFKARLDEPELLISVLDFILMDDAWVRAFCDAEGLGYDVPLRVRQSLPGGAEMHWT